MSAEANSGSPPAAARTGLTWGDWLLVAAAIYFLSFKVVALFMGAPHADEAYYWMWGQHPAWSYFDHPPFHAWLQGLAEQVFGWNLFALRIWSLVGAGLSLWIIALWTRRLAPVGWRRNFVLGAALLYSAPLVTLYTTIATNDRILFVCTIGALHFFAWFFADWREGNRRYWALYLAAACVGLAALTKYYGALIGLGAAIVILSDRDLRALLRTPHLYAAAALSVLMQAPTIYWNLTHGMASLRFHTMERAGVIDFSRLRVGETNTLLFETLVLLSPAAVIAILLLFAIRAGGGLHGPLLRMARWLFVLSSGFVLALSLWNHALFYWNLIAYAALFAVAFIVFRWRWLAWLQIVYGMVVGTVLLVQFSIHPILSHPRADGIYGWPAIAEQVTATKQRYGADLVGAPSWGVASRLGFALGDRDVLAINAETDAFDYWTDYAALAGKDVVILVEPGQERLLPYVGGHFSSFERVGEVLAESFGVPIKTYKIYLGRGFTAAPED